LIVEDDEDIARFLEKHLGSDGWDTAVAEDALVALDWLAGHDRPDVVIPGAMLPRMDGFELTKRIMSQDNPPPVVICAAQRAVEEGIEAGAVDYITKPFNPNDLLQRVWKARVRGPGRGSMTGQVLKQGDVWRPFGEAPGDSVSQRG
jgi:DNA-binding response OmpR family regulator